MDCGGRRGKRAALLLALAFACTGTSMADDGLTPEAPTLTGDIVGAEGAGVWLGAIGEDPDEATWTYVEGARFEIPATPGEQVALVAIALDRVPLVVRIPPDAHDRGVELALSRGLTLEGSVRSEHGGAVRGVDVRMAAAGAVVLEGPALAGSPFSLRDAKMKIALGDRAVDVPPFARPAWTTSEDGTFRIGGLEPGRYFLEAKMTGFVPAFESNVGIREDDDNTLDIELFEASHIAGHVVDDEGFPAPDAEVRAHWHVPARGSEGDAGGSGHYPLRSTARSAADGSFRLGPLDAGPLVRISAESAGFGASRPLHVQAPYEDLVVELARHAVRGRVVDAATGEPLKSYRVTHRTQYQYFREAHTVRLGDGLFEMVVDPDARLVRIEAPGRSPWVARVFTGAGREYDLGEIRLEKARTITGRVRDARSGEPVSGALVRRSPRRYQDRYLRMYAANHFGSRGTKTDAEGAFALGGLPSGADLLEVWSTPGGAVGRTVELPRGIGHLEIALGFHGVVSGSLALPDGAPTEGTVRLWERVEGSWAEAMTRTVGEDGVFRWVGIGDGEYRVTARSEMGTVSGPSRTFSLRDGAPVEDIQLVVEPGGRLFGRLSGLPRTGWARVELLDGGGQFVSKKDLGNGPFELAGVPDHGRLAVTTSDGRVVRRSIRLDDEARAQVDIDFSGQARLTGMVSAGGRPLSGMGLAVVPRDKLRPTAYAATSELGRYAVQSLSEGAYSVRTGTGYSFEVHVARDAVLDIELPPISLSGRVRVEPETQSAGGAWVSLAGPDTPPSTEPLRTVIASDGGFRFDGLRAGEYVVRVSHRDFAEVSRRIRIAAEEVVEFQLRPNMTL